MQLPGRLTGTTLGDVLGTIHRARATGVLELIETLGPAAGRSHRIRIEAGLVSRVDTSMPSARLGEILQEQGYLPEGAPQRIAAAAVDSARPTGKLLVERDLVSVEQISRALHEQVRRRLEPLFGIADARVRFHVPRPHSKDSSEPDPLSAQEFLHGRPRARGHTSVRQGREQGAPSTRALAVLGLRPGADLSEVKQAFRRLAAASHPDRFPHASEVDRVGMLQRLSQLTAAYHELMAGQLARGA